MNCEKCGKELEKGAKVCPSCGQKVTVSHKIGEDSKVVAEKTGEGLGKGARGFVEGTKTFGASMKKGWKKDDKKGEAAPTEEKKE